MKLLIEVKDSQAKIFLAFLNSLSYVKSKAISKEKQAILDGLQEAVKELNQLKTGKRKGIPAKELYEEL